MKPTELVEKVLEYSKADDCIVIVEEATSVNVRFANNTTTTNGATHEQELIILAVKDKKVGMVHRNFVEAAGLEALVREAEAACEFAPPAEDYFALESDDGGAPTGWEAPVPATEVGVFEKLARELAAAFKLAEGAGQKLFGYAEHNASTLWLGSSKGLRKRHDQLRGQIEITGKTADFATSAWAGQATRDFTDVDLTAMVAGLRERLEWSKTKLELAAGTYDTLLEPSAVADLIVYAYWTAAARDAAEGRTVFSKAGGDTRVGERLAAKNISVYSDPHEPALGVADFEVAGGSSSHASIFDNGVALRKTAWIEDGVLKHLITPRYWAAKSGIEARPYIDNLVMTTGDKRSTADLIKGMKRGLLVTCLWYIREVDPQRLLLTGLTRDGVFLVEDGQVKGAVNNFRFNMSPVGMLDMVAEAGATGPTLAREFGDYFTFTKMPPLVIRDFNMSSVSQAT